MLTEAHLRRHPKVFRSMTGITAAEFDALARDAVPALATADEARLTRPGRRRGIGAGHPQALSPRNQVLVTIIWLRQYPTDGVLGYLAGVDEATIRRVRKRVLPVLEALGADTMRGIDPGKWKRPGLAGLLVAAPELILIVDSFEQAVQRPKVRSAADGWCSGKKKQHARKIQVVVDAATGVLAALSPAVPGPTRDLQLLKTTALLADLPADVTVLGDLAYVGIATLHPGGATPKRKPREQPRPPEDVAFNRVFARRRVIVEHSIRRLRIYASMTARDRRHRRIDGRSVACAGLVNRQLLTGSAMR